MDDEKRITLRLPLGLHERVAERARVERRSLNSEIVYLLESVVDAAAPGASASPDPLRGKPDSSPA